MNINLYTVQGDSCDVTWNLKKTLNKDEALETLESFKENLRDRYDNLKIVKEPWVFETKKYCLRFIDQDEKVKSAESIMDTMVIGGQDRLRVDYKTHRARKWKTLTMYTLPREEITGKTCSEIEAYIEGLK